MTTTHPPRARRRTVRPERPVRRRRPGLAAEAVVAAYLHDLTGGRQIIRQEVAGRRAPV